MTNKTNSSTRQNKHRFNKYRGKKLKSVPETTRIVSDRVAKFPVRSFMLKSLDICRKDARLRMYRILETLIDAVDWSTLRIGVAKKEFLDPITYKAFMKRHERLHNETIPRSTWYRYIKKITDAGYLNSITARMSTSEGKVFNKPAYKWFTRKFMTELGFKKDWLSQQQEHALKSLKAKGLSNQWRVFKGHSARIAHSMAISLQTTQDYRYCEAEPFSNES